MIGGTEIWGYTKKLLNPIVITIGKVDMTEWEGNETWLFEIQIQKTNAYILFFTRTFHRHRTVVVVRGTCFP